MRVKLNEFLKCGLNSLWNLRQYFPLVILHCCSYEIMKLVKLFVTLHKEWLKYPMNILTFSFNNAEKPTS